MRLGFNYRWGGPVVVTDTPQLTNKGPMSFGGFCFARTIGSKIRGLQQPEELGDHHLALGGALVLETRYHRTEFMNTRPY